MSRQWTSWPSSAKQAAVTRPTQPAPMTPIGSRSGMARERSEALAEGLGGAGDRQHLGRAERLRQRVGDPVDGAVRLPRDQLGARAVAVEAVGLAADLPGLR